MGYPAGLQHLWKDIIKLMSGNSTGTDRMEEAKRKSIDNVSSSFNIQALVHKGPKMQLPNEMDVCLKVQGCGAVIGAVCRSSGHATCRPPGVDVSYMAEKLRYMPQCSY